MRELEILLENYWVFKRENKELYYQIKDAIPKMKGFIEEKLGYQLIVNPHLIKLEKLPGKPEGWMGIQAFDQPLEYTLLCLLLTFLEDKGAEEQFVLSEITEFMQGMYPEENKLDWTLFQHRRSLIKVMRLAEEMHMIQINDGDDNQFTNEQGAEVLYENTGISRYFMRHFTGNILNYKTWQDIEINEWLDMDRDRGRVRRNRVYRRLIMSPVVYQEGIEDPDYLYIKNYRSMLQNDLEKHLKGSLHVHRNGALLLLDAKGSFKDTFPNQRSISDVVLFMNRRILADLAAGAFFRKDDDTILLTLTAFEDLVVKVMEAYGEGWSKTHREMTATRLCREILDFMSDFQMLEVDERRQEVRILPLVGKIIGGYPSDFLSRVHSEEDKSNEE